VNKPYYHDSHRTLYNHDCRLMPELPDESVLMVVTSPPYWGLRKYAGEQTLTGWACAYGLEPTPELYVQHTVEILREIRRVLHKDGVVFWNIGDSYAGSGRGLNADGTDGGSGKKQLTNVGNINTVSSKRIPRGEGRWGGGNSPASGVLKPKDLCLIPFRVAIAAQEDGWWVRSDIIWSKNNPMPESVRDRPTESHEHILMLTKSAHYYWDAEVVRENLTPSSITRLSQNIGEQKGSDRIPGKTNGPMKACASGWHGSSFNDGRNKELHPECSDAERDEKPGRNIRSVWTFPTQPYKAAHYATFPEELPERCIKAATPEAGCCSKCGQPWERMVERKTVEHDGITNGGKVDNTKRLALKRQAAREAGHEYVNQTKTLGWKSACNCEAPPVPSTVLDPFAGSGTTLFVAARLGRKSVGYEISEEYCRLIVNRNRQHVLV
jgi:DNA modification methylase